MPSPQPGAEALPSPGEQAANGRPRSPFAVRSRKACAPVVVVTALVLATCAPKPSSSGDDRVEEPPLEVEEVGAAPDAAHDPSTDPQEKRRPTSHLGVLPGDYPAGLPVPPESSLVDYGDRDDGARFVELHTTAGVDTVRDALEGAWRAAGWERNGEAFHKDGQTAAFTVEALSPTLTRVEIVWRTAP